MPDAQTILAASSLQPLSFVHQAFIHLTYLTACHNHGNYHNEACLISRTLKTAGVQMHFQSIFPVNSKSLHHQEGSQRVGKILLRVLHCTYAVFLKVCSYPATNVIGTYLVSHSGRYLQTIAITR